MSLTPAGFTGKIVVHVQMKAKPGEGDKLEDALLKVQQSVYSDAEPGGIEFRVCRHQDNFLLFEEYDSVAALGPHQATEAFKNLAAVGEEYRDGAPICLFFEEVGSRAKL